MVKNNKCRKNKGIKSFQENASERKKKWKREEACVFSNKNILEGCKGKKYARRVTEKGAIDGVQNKGPEGVHRKMQEEIRNRCKKVNETSDCRGTENSDRRDTEKGGRRGTVKGARRDTEKGARRDTEKGDKVVQTKVS